MPRIAFCADEITVDGNIAKRSYNVVNGPMVGALTFGLCCGAGAGITAAQAKATNKHTMYNFIAFSYIQNVSLN